MELTEGWESKYYMEKTKIQVLFELREDLEIMPPKRLSEVEEAQREVIETAMRMSSEGQITMPGGGSEEMV